jgi:adenine-specific DNA-methyltransferase
MNTESLDEHVRLEALEILAELISDPTGGDPGPGRDGHRIYRIALGRLVNSFLDRCVRARGPATAAKRDHIAARLSERLPMAAPEQIGELYEYLRGFQLESGDRTRPRLVPSRKGRRNQGLFYTPPAIVSHIVERTLDALNIQDPIDFLSVKLLDPALGTGVFLARALDAIVDRVLAGGEGRSHDALERISILNRARDPIRGQRSELDTRSRVRIHVLEHCLYGVDLDPIAVQVARILLANGALKDMPEALDLEPRVRLGNSLMGTGFATPAALCRAIEDERHATAYFGPKLARMTEVSGWARATGLFHWPLEFPEVFRGPRKGFDAVVGNPPYEIVSVKESGLRERTREQAYFRKAHRTCQGKINTYRLMLERGLDLLADGGTLGFIVPATLLADSSAEKIRRLVLDCSTVVEASVIPEKARVFEGVTQALLILILRKGDKTRSIRPIFRNSTDPRDAKPGACTNRRLIEMTGGRVPLLRTDEEKKFLEAILRYPQLAGNGNVEPVAQVHQGEINLTTHRECITVSPTGYPLIRGEHVFPFRLVHPSRRGKRLDWVLPEMLGRGRYLNKAKIAVQRLPLVQKPREGRRGTPWDSERIVLGRVVNMATDRRLKAAAVPPGTFLGDMTNFLRDPTEPPDYLLGLLNSRLLNWRIKITSTNNYLSAQEIGSLPVPRTDSAAMEPTVRRWIGEQWAPKLLPRLVDDSPSSIGHALVLLESALPRDVRVAPEACVPTMIGITAAMMRSGRSQTLETFPEALRNLLDALVLMLFRCDSYAPVVEE